jgi:hypothetical protein
MRFPLTLLACGLVLNCAGAAAQQACRLAGSVQSGPRTAALVELFTSEGCDSCPPADRWLATLKPAPGGLVPLAFHVDYWDYIGWKDPFAQPQFAARQRDAVRRQRGHVAYTPQVLVDGTDASIWASSSRADAALAKVVARPPRARLSLRADAAVDALDVELRVQPAGSIPREARAFVVLTESRLESRVAAGENRGQTLRHDHVVREFVGPFLLGLPSQDTGETVIRKRFAAPSSWKQQDLSVSAFLQDMITGEVLQAVRIPACADAR